MWAVCGLVYGLGVLGIRGEIGLGESAQCTQRQLCGLFGDWSVECLAYDEARESVQAKIPHAPWFVDCLF